jgi:RNA polymerase sigma factor (sigma-70 family)
LWSQIRSFRHYLLKLDSMLNCEGWMSPPDEQCVLSCLDGHPEAFRHLVERYQTPIMRHLCGCLGSVDEAEEVAQEAFVRAYFALRELRKPDAFFAWLFGIADRVVRETHRAAQRRRTVDCEQIELAAPVVNQQAGPDAAVTEAVAALPEAYREVIVLRFYGGKSCAEISRELNVPLGTVTKRLSRAYALLRERLSASDANRESEASP